MINTTIIDLGGCMRCDECKFFGHGICMCYVSFSSQHIHLLSCICCLVHGICVFQLAHACMDSRLLKPLQYSTVCDYEHVCMQLWQKFGKLHSVVLATLHALALGQVAGQIKQKILCMCLDLIMQPAFCQLLLLICYLLQSIMVILLWSLPLSGFELLFDTVSDSCLITISSCRGWRRVPPNHLGLQQSRDASCF